MHTGGRHGLGTGLHDRQKGQENESPPVLVAFQSRIHPPPASRSPTLGQTLSFYFSTAPSMAESSTVCRCEGSADGSLYIPIPMGPRTNRPEPRRLAGPNSQDSRDSSWTRPADIAQFQQDTFPHFPALSSLIFFLCSLSMFWTWKRQDRRD